MFQLWIPVTLQTVKLIFPRDMKFYFPNRNWISPGRQTLNRWLMQRIINRNRKYMRVRILGCRVTIFNCLLVFTAESQVLVRHRWRRILPEPSPRPQDDASRQVIYFHSVWSFERVPRMKRFSVTLNQNLRKCSLIHQPIKQTTDKECCSQFLVVPIILDSFNLLPDIHAYSISRSFIDTC